MNGAPLPRDHGYPARLVVAGLYGYVSATKWLESVELTTWDAFDGYWIPRGWSKLGPIKTASRIDVPSTSVPAGELVVAGVAWAPGRGISRVEVQIDDGNWVECDLSPSASDETWVQWRSAWAATPGSHVLRVRATDGDGEVQTMDQAPPAPDGATGYHTRRVEVT
jgi:Oxidoreductase molybdopterin binding domain